MSFQEPEKYQFEKEVPSSTPLGRFYQSLVKTECAAAEKGLRLVLDNQDKIPMIDVLRRIRYYKTCRRLTARRFTKCEGRILAFQRAVGDLHLEESDPVAYRDEVDEMAGRLYECARQPTPVADPSLPNPKNKPIWGFFSVKDDTPQEPLTSSSLKAQPLPNVH